MVTFGEAPTSEEVIAAFAPQVKGRTFVITGASDQSLGGYNARVLASASPARIVIVSRTPKNVEPVLAAIQSVDSSIKTTFVQCDLSDHDSVRAAAPKVLDAAPVIDVLINNAGVMALPEYTKDKQGIEKQLSCNHVGHFLLTNLLVPGLLAAASKTNDARVVNYTSQGYRISPFRFEDWNFSDGKTYEMWTGYGQSKTANILFSWGLTKRLKSRGVTSTALHPGVIFGTGLATHLPQDAFANIDEITERNTGRKFTWDLPETKDVTQGAATALVAALDPDLPAKSPAYLSNCKVQEPHDYASDPEKADKLWKLSEELVKQEFAY